jgi:hypothetical protein
MKVQSLFPGLVQSLVVESERATSEAPASEPALSTEASNQTGEDLQGALIRLSEWQRKKSRKSKRSQDSKILKAHQIYIRVDGGDIPSIGQNVDLRI